MANQFRVTRLADASAAVGTAKTMLRLLAGANSQITIVSFQVGFDSVSSSDKPIKVQLRYETTTSAPTGTSVTPTPQGPSKSAVAQTSCLVNCSAEGTPTYDTNDFETLYVPATSGLYLSYPLGREPVGDISKAIRLVVTAITNAVNVSYGIVWEE